ncbi:sensor domain-containing diguanylate cyclase [Solibacillus sp. FSL K6-1126]|uniref:sensor domain-containing diguanylate cyclase n=1 Tax=Solibacillus sp. FSL K6-1126 TaxID=2921463 RepID=UPI0030F953A2
MDLLLSKTEHDFQSMLENYRILSENMRDLISIIDLKGRCEFVSASHARILGIYPEELQGEYAGNWLHPHDADIVARRLKRLIETNKECTFRFRYGNNRREWKWLEAKASPIFAENGTLEKILIVSSDITERIRYEENLKHLAYHDPLTELPNRRLFRERLRQSIKEAECYGHEMAVMYMDLDNFKQVNDSLGHAVGDKLLQQFAGRVEECLCESDTLSRRGGDEFTVLFPEIQEKNDVKLIAERINEFLRKPWYIRGHIFTTTTSIGVAFYPQDGLTPHELLENADSALYKVKARGKDNYSFYRYSDYDI